jgi:NADH dehydrogenase [ubiquinone] 1 alpha subcomplex assembly factor 5
MTTAQDIGTLLTSTGFTMLTLDIDDIVIHYPTLFELIYDLKEMGESNCTWNRSLNLSVDKLLAAQAIYKEMYSNGEEKNGIPATYQILYFIAWKPDESQAKPARRGSGQVSLKELGSIDDLLKNKK